jgi:hypothetical protein
MIRLQIVKVKYNEKFITYALRYRVLNACGLHSRLTALRLTQLHHRGLCSFVMLLASTGGLSLTCCPPNVCNKLPIFKSQNVLDILSLEDRTEGCHKIYKMILLSIPEQQQPQLHFGTTPKLTKYVIIPIITQFTAITFHSRSCVKYHFRQHPHYGIIVSWFSQHCDYHQLTAFGSHNVH